MEQTFTFTNQPGEAEIEAACAKLNLQLTMKGALKSLPPNTHWHYKMPQQKGVLEITLMLQEHKLIFNCKKNRLGDWVNEVIERLIGILKLASNHK